MPNQFWIDGHIDMAYLALSGRDLWIEHPDPSKQSVTFPAFRRGSVGLILGTIFTESGSPGEPCGYAAGDAEAARAAGVRQLDWYRAQEDRGAISLVRRKTDLQAPIHTESNAPLRVVLLMEGADPIRDADDAAWWHQRGLRACGLTWARGTRWAGGNGAPGPLLPGAIELLSALDALGVIHDTSHLSDEGLEGLLANARGSVVASHSNCRAITGDSQRHLTDSQIAAIAARGGVIGLNLYGKFLATDRAATLADALDHVVRVRTLGGSGAIALGSDMDGGFPPLDVPAGVRSPDQYQSLADGLMARGLSEGDVAGFCSSNWLRVLSAALPD